MKKVISLVLAAVVAGSVSALPPMRTGAEAKAAAETPSNFSKRPFRQLIPSRSPRKAAADMLKTAPQHPVVLRNNAPKNNAPVRRSVKLSDGLQLQGSVISSSDFSFVPGLYTVPLTAGGSFEMIGSGISVEYAGYDDGNGKYYVASIQDWGMGFVIPELYIYSTETWEELEYAENVEFSILGTDNAIDPTDGSVYGCYYNNDYNKLTWAKADYAAGSSKAISTLADDERMFGVACDANGQFYAVLENGNFVRVNKTTGELTVVGDTGLRPYYMTSATFDVKSNTFIFSYAPATGTGSLWAIDPATAEASLILDFADNNEVTALTVVSPDAEPGAPAAPAFEASTSGGSLTVDFTLTMPDKLFDGSTPAEAEADWTVMLDGKAVKTGKAAYGDVVKDSYTLPAEGRYTFSAYAVNAAGRSPITKADIVAGTGLPLAPAGLKAATDGNGSAWLNWSAVTASADGGYIDPAAVTYTVWRDGVKVADNISDTFFEETLDIPDTFKKVKYAVEASYAGKTSDRAETSVGIGSIKPPYACTFSSTPDDGLYSVENTNGDNTEWYFSPYYAAFKYDYSSIAADDWLFTPAFHLEKGNIYEFSYSIAAGHTNYTERYAVAMGAAPTSEAMVKQLVAPTEFTGDLGVFRTETLTINPEQTGIYYFGWHAISDASQFMIQVKDVRVSAPMAASSPSEATDITLTPDADGHLVVKGSFKAPATDISGAALTSLGTVTVTREGKDEAVKVFSNPTPGAVLEFTDSDIAEAGTYTYTVASTGSDGTVGREAQASVIVGPVAPENVPVVRLVEGDTPGTVILTWDAPELNVEGNPLNPDNITYMVYVAGEGNVAHEVLDAPVTEREARFTVCEPSEMAFAVFYVSAFNLGLESKGLTRSPMVPVGKAEKIPYRQSFNAEDRKGTLLGYVIPENSYSEVKIGSYATSGVAAQDGDDAFISIYCSGQYEQPEFFTGKLDISGAATPAVTLYHYVWSGADANTFDVVAVNRQGLESLLGTVDHSKGCTEGWNIARFSLENLIDKEVRILVRVNPVTHENMFFDNITVRDLPDFDLAASAVSVPSRVEALKEFTVKVSVANLGIEPCEGYTVELLRGGKAVAELKGPQTEPGKEVTVDFIQTLEPTAETPVEYSARVTIDGDSDEANNTSPVATTSLIIPKLPAVNDLAATRTASGISLSWTAPSTAGYDAKEVEDFEDGKAWSGEVDGWTMVDRDGAQIGKLDGAALPEAAGMRTRHAFFVFDNDDEDLMLYNPALAGVLKARSGSKCLVAMYSLDVVKGQDDWAISPELTGKAQRISFYARSFHPEYLDNMEVLYATENTTDPDKFVSLCPEGAVKVPQLTDAIGNAAYTLYEYDLPEGALRFAIRAINPGGEGLMLMVDDVKFDVANPVLEIKGYTIYRDGAVIGTADASATSFTDSEAGSAAHRYNVVVNFNRGISAASNNADLTAGIEGVAAAACRVYADRRHIVVEGLAADATLAVHATDGRCLYSGTGNVRVAVPAGIYLVSAGTEVSKIIVR